MSNALKDLYLKYLLHHIYTPIFSDSQTTAKHPYMHQNSATNRKHEPLL